MCTLKTNSHGKAILFEANHNIFPQGQAVHYGHHSHRKLCKAEILWLVQEYLNVPSHLLGYETVKQLNITDGKEKTSNLWTEIKHPLRSY